MGYENLMNSGNYYIDTTMLLIGVFFMFGFIQYWVGGDPYYNLYNDDDNWGKTPIQYWVKEDDKWILKLKYGEYKDRGEGKFNWEWIAEARAMGWLAEAPPAECSIICSAGMHESVDKILKKQKT